MIGKIYKSLKARSLNLFKKIRRIYNQLFNFYFSNYKTLYKKKLHTANTPICNQKLLVTGNGFVEIGSNCSFGYKLGGHFYSGLIEIQPRYLISKIVIGNNVTINNNLFICSANYVEIGDDTLIGEGVSILDHEAHGVEIADRKKLGDIGKVLIGKNVWIGNNVTILKNSEIGDNSVVAAGAIVSGKFSSNVIIGGIPAKVIRPID
jgi:acetyltransferase-like isoleucine patch superfamily enzyme